MSDTINKTRVVAPVDEQRVREITREEFAMLWSQIDSDGKLPEPAAVEWGDLIAVDGVRPAWLTSTPALRWYISDSCYNETHYQPVWFGEANLWQGIQSIRLPADHFAYKAIAAGFEPWGGGDAAPEDLDATQPLLNRAGTVADYARHPWARWDHAGSGGDTIGYRKRADPLPINTVTAQAEIRRRTLLDGTVIRDTRPTDRTITTIFPTNPVCDRLTRYVIWRRSVDAPAAATIETSPYADGMNSLLDDLASVFGIA